MKAAVMRRRSSRPVIWKKPATYPHLAELEDWLTWTKEQDVAKRVKAIVAHLAKEDVKEKTSIAGVMKDGQCHEVKVKDMGKEELATLVSKMDRMPEIVAIEEGGKTKHFVVVHTMGPHNVNVKLTPWIKKEQGKEKTVNVTLRGVEDEVISLDIEFIQMFFFRCLQGWCLARTVPHQPNRRG